MSTTIVPAIGHGALFTQAGVAAGYDAVDLRRIASSAVREGATGNLPYKVSQRAAGANMSVDIAAQQGACFVTGDSVVGQGSYYVAHHTAIINEVITAAHATLPRLDQVVLEVLDDTHAGGGSNLARTRVVDGTATAGATLDNRNGAAALPASALRLADVIVAAADTSIVTAEIRDRRTWNLGFNVTVYGTTSGPTKTAGAASVIPEMTVTGEFHGTPVTVDMSGQFKHSAGGNPITFELWVDGVAVTGQTSTRVLHAGLTGGDALGGDTPSWSFTPAAGRHIVAAAWSVGAGTATAETTRRSFTVVERVGAESQQN